MTAVCSHAFEVKSGNPFAVGLSAVRAIVVPMVVLWAVAAALVFSYYALPSVAALFEPLSRWQTENGLLAAFLNRVMFCGVIPGLFLLAVRSLRPRRPLLTIFAQSCWCGLWGMVVDLFYRLLDVMLGAGVDWSTLALKTVADELVLTPLVISPADAVFFFWLGRDFSLARVRLEWPTRFIRGLLAPNLIANWCVWIPTGFVIFAFPLPLQVQLSGLLSSVWTLMCLQIGIFSVKTRKGSGHA